eukprot:g15131.t1
MATVRFTPHERGVRLLVVASVLAISTLQGCEPETPEELQGTSDTALAFAIVGTVLAVLGLGGGWCSVCMDDGPSSEKRSYCACAVGFLCCWLVVGLPPWIVFANYQAQMTCDTLRSMQPELCWRGTWWGWQEGSEGSGFTALECCRGPPVATVTMTSVTMTSTTMTLTTLPAIPYCQCEAASSSALQCETGAGRSCITNLTDWTACFEEGRLCEASDGCITKPEFERVQYVNGGLCLQSASRPAICKGLVIAASSEDREFCSPEQDCEVWDRVKYMLGIMYEAELGDIIIDSLAICFCLAALCLKHKGQRGKYILLATFVSFMADIALEVLLADSVGGAKDVVAELEEAVCISPQGDFYNSLVILKDLANTIATLAWVNVGIAILGGLSEVLQTFMDACGKKVLERTAVGLVVAASVFELGLGCISFGFNTLEFIAVVKDIEVAALGLQTMEDDYGHMCYVRNPDLTPATAQGVMWIQPGLIMVMPSVVVCCFFLAAAVYTYRCAPPDEPEDEAPQEVVITTPRTPGTPRSPRTPRSADAPVPPDVPDGSED